MKSIDLSIIIVNYQTKDKVKDCLASILKIKDYKFSYEIIIVENSFGQDSFDKNELNLFGNNIKFIFNQKNLGMGKGNNIGIEHSLGEYILVLNPDIVVLNRAIEDLFFYLKNNPEIGIIGPKLISKTDSLMYSCYFFPKLYTPILRRTFLKKIFVSTLANYQMKNFDHSTIKEVDWLCGASLMFKRKIVLGQKFFEPKFDKRYFLYFEDTDICRESWSHGFRVVYYPQAEMKHLITRKSVQRSHICSWIKYFFKWGLKTKNEV